MSTATIRLLLSLLDQVTLAGSDPNLERVAVALTTARRELEETLALIEEEN